MVDQYGRDIKPAGWLPASASLSPRLPCFPFPEPLHPQVPLTHTSEGPAPPSPPPTVGELREAESLDRQEEVSMGVGREYMEVGVILAGKGTGRNRGTVSPPGDSRDSPQVGAL